MWLALLISAPPVHAQEPLGGSDLIVTLAPGQTGRIILDGRDTGVMAPGSVSGVTAGEHRVQVRGDCLLGMGFVTVVPGQLARVAVDLQTTGGFVEVSVIPPQATILIDGETVGVGPSVGSELSCGEHEIEARAETLGSQTRTIRVDMGTAQALTLDLTLPPPPPPAAPAPPAQDLTGLRKGLGIGLAALGVGGLGTAVWLQRQAWTDYRDHYVPTFEACGDVACQEDLQAYRSETIGRAWYGSMIAAGLGAVSLTTAGVVGLTSDGYPVMGLTRRW